LIFLSFDGPFRKGSYLKYRTRKTVYYLSLAREILDNLGFDADSTPAGPPARDLLGPETGIITPETILSLIYLQHAKLVYYYLPKGSLFKETACCNRFPEYKLIRININYMFQVDYAV
jgi:hypothetical protein